MKTAVLAVVAAGAFAGSAQASVIDTDSVKLTSTGYDFGGSDWGIGSPVNSGEIHYHLEGGQVRPHVRGTLHINDADGTCARMRLEYFNDSGAWLRTEYGGEVCVTDDRHHEATVDLDPYADNSIDSVRVSVQKETVAGWSTTDSETYGADTFLDTVLITEDGVDFGGSGFLYGEPGTDGEVHWELDEGVVEPRLIGAVHLNNSSGACARMTMRYLTEDGIHLRTESGGTVCATHNGRHEWGVDLSPYASNRIGRVEVQLQTQGSNGSWNTAGWDAASIEE